MNETPSPAIAVVGRHNSGKTTLMEKLIAELVARGLDVGSVKHHSHRGFEFDVPGKDSWRHRKAGASETVIAAPGQVARVKTVDGEVECADLVRSMPGHDIVLVEGYRHSGLPTIEIMRAGNPADVETARAFVEGARQGWPLETDFTQAGRDEAASAPAPAAEPAPAREPAPTSSTVAVVTDIDDAREAAGIYGIPAFGFDDVAAIADFVERGFSRTLVTVVIQAGGESKRMGRSKALVPFANRPLICRMVERVAPVADELLITTNEPEKLGFLRDKYPQYQIRLVSDVYDKRGALPGLFTAFTYASHPIVAVVACDMVFACSDLIEAEIARMVETGADVVVPVNKHGFEPFHAVYRRTVCLKAVGELIGEGAARAQALFDRVRTEEFTTDDVRAVEPLGRCFVNANTRDELRKLEEIVLKEQQ